MLKQWFLCLVVSNFKNKDKSVSKHEYFLLYRSSQSVNQETELFPVDSR